MRTIVCYIGIALYLIGMTPLLFRAWYLRKKGRLEELESMVGRAAQNWAKRMMKLAGMEVQVTGLEHIPEGPVVFASNHQSDFDTLVQMGGLGRAVGFVAKKEIKRVPFLAQWMELLHCVFIDRKNPASAMRLLLNDSVAALRAGHSLIINPEGTRSKCDEVRPFKYGGFKMARAAAVPLVPVAIDGSYRAWEGNGGWIKPCRVRLMVLEAVDMAALSEEEARTIHETVRQRIIAAKAAEAPPSEASERSERSEQSEQSV